LVAVSHQASKFGSTKILSYLLHKTPLNTGLRDKKGRTALDYAKEIGCSADIINSLTSLH